MGTQGECLGLPESEEVNQKFGADKGRILPSLLPFVLPINTFLTRLAVIFCLLVMHTGILCSH